MVPQEKTLYSGRPIWRFDARAVRMKMFDNLVHNPDRNAGNLLVIDDLVKRVGPPAYVK